MTTSFDFNSITSPADLAKANDEVKTPFATVIDNLDECGYRESMAVVMYLLKNISEHHYDGVVKNEEACLFHAFNHGRVASALNVLQPLADSLLEGINQEAEESEGE